MKKSISITLIIILIIGGILAGLPSKVYALNSASLSPTSRTVTEGDTVSVTVNMGQTISAANFGLTCSSSDVLTYISVSKGIYNPSSGRFSYASVSDDTTSVTFTYRANKAGTATISASGVTVSSGDSNKVSISISPSSATITVNPKATPTPTPTPAPTQKPEQPSNPTPVPTRTPDTPNNDNPQVTDIPEEPTQTPTPTPEVTEEPNNEEENTTNNEETNNNNEGDTEKAPNRIIKINEEDDIKTIKNEENDIMIKAKSIAISEEDVTLSVTLIEEETERFNDLTKITKSLKGNKKFYDIKLLKDGLAIETNGYVTVYLPIPEGYNKDRLEAYSIDEQTEKYEKRDGEVQGNYYTFTTDKLEAFALVEKEASTKSSKIKNIIFMVLGAMVILAIITIIIKKMN